MTQESTRSKATILIVDDEPYNVDYLQQTLSDIGYDTREAFGGREALAAVAESTPDLIVLDVMMPDLDGITVCRMLKGDPATRFIPIIIMTALGSVEDRVRGIEAGADDFLTKPVDDRELLARIDSALRAKHAVDETVEELASAAMQLEALGSRIEDMIVIAVDLRAGEASEAGLAANAEDYLKARYGRMVRGALERHGATVLEAHSRHHLAVIELSDELSDTRLAIDAALAIRDEAASLNRSNQLLQIDVAVAVHRGEVSLEPARVADRGGTRWTRRVGGPGHDEAIRMLHSAGDNEIVASASILDRDIGRYQVTPSTASDEFVRTLGPQVVMGMSDTPGPAAPARTVPRSRVLATILVSDLVGSTEMATRLGDQSWSEVLDNHYRLVRGILGQYQGEEISTAGDGFLAIFDGPARAVHAGLAITRRSGELGLPVRVGIHTGEVVMTDDDVQGIAVHVAARVSAASKAGTVLVSATTKEAVAGSDLEFEDLGEHVLKGVEGPRRLFAAVT